MHPRLPRRCENSLDHKYLHLAEWAGAGIRPLTEARTLVPQPDGTWRVHTRHGTGRRRSAVLFAMEQGDSHLTSRYRRGRLTLHRGIPQPEPVRLATSEAVAHQYARQIGGRAALLWNTALGLPVTAHLLGGCPIGSDPATSVADLYHRIHGYPTLRITDASAVPGNLGANPALTVTAMAERAYAAWPTAGQPDQRPAQSEPYRHLLLPKTQDTL
ncbi:GMC oxidoreductase [Streptomyces iakyrus]|uniref:GMC oxidoreductase n=1 Tax=Streptomyces iakyrus TaxID=68219 RepID=UPI0036B79845